MTQLQPLPSWLMRWLPVGGLFAVAALAYGLGLQDYLSLKVLAENEVALLAYVKSHLLISLFIYSVIYIAVVALSLPGAALLSVIGGFLFGWALSAPVSTIAATLGAVIVFLIVKSSIGAFLAERASPFVKKLSDGFKEDAFSYLLFLRLVPAFPFFAVNAVAGLARVELRIFTFATFFGIMPGAIAFAWLGRGLGSVIDAQVSAQHNCIIENGMGNCPFEISVLQLVTPQLLTAFVLLGSLALIPVALKRWNRSHRV